MPRQAIFANVWQESAISVAVQSAMIRQVESDFGALSLLTKTRALPLRRAAERAPVPYLREPWVLLSGAHRGAGCFSPGVEAPSSDGCRALLARFHCTPRIPGASECIDTACVRHVTPFARHLSDYYGGGREWSRARNGLEEVMPGGEAFKCPSCGASLVEQIGSAATVACRFCGTHVVVPESLRPPDKTARAVESFASVIKEVARESAARQAAARRPPDRSSGSPVAGCLVAAVIGGLIFGTTDLARVSAGEEGPAKARPSGAALRTPTRGVAAAGGAICRRDLQGAEGAHLELDPHLRRAEAPNQRERSLRDPPGIAPKPAGRSDRISAICSACSWATAGSGASGRQPDRDGWPVEPGCGVPSMCRSTRPGRERVSCRGA